ncbi:cytochrome c biogenesis protein CcsA [Tuwongella immobilis]|uniref:Cytochrome c assembly protein domain-containing protein n=1 Tax=Tuwongella immobilis TaxID=692036 RepID=A0A6C2YVV5_9BACT|nr:cytochrome c biogenesis protein CcsA [Tuwongella immobilis]VIP05035.1 cytochrome c assembly protein : Cytochrome c biogenesis protein, CcmF/CcyK/CcsA family OS=Planctomyces maris DSM 8797 GN=PM8797T_01539 PE=4 SV=1: Cytochrom_C_asm [Tuwongella immobilis]VTS07426.1 cytochrome c assembly protein : Cytochrome c biogenesis protein, CcmF/CcyK/CcsA family OS=Planctomyces maris DSM 8797 GN=PM8797T_01539 PE=4 SV=1: Cytochrom_C_asm [Tuwongella immobilis]
MLLEGITRFCFAASYSVALLLEVAQLIRPAGVSRWLVRIFSGAGLFAHTFYLIWNLPSPASPSGSMLLLSWVLAVFQLYGMLNHRRVAWSVFVLPVVLALIVLSELLLRYGPSDPVLQGVALLSGERFWGGLHGVMVMFAAVGITVAGVASVMYLIQAERLRRKQNPIAGLRLLSLERLESMNRHAVVWAFPLLTVGLLIGMIRMVTLDSHIADWAALKVLSTSALWLTFLLLLVLRFRVHLPGRRLAAWTLLAFGLMLLALASSHPWLAEDWR